MQIESGSGILVLFIVGVALLVFVTSIWVFIDATNIGVKAGQIPGLAGMGPGGWLFACLGIWIVAFPYYLSVRDEFKRLNSTPQPAPPTQTTYAITLPDGKEIHLTREQLEMAHENATVESSFPAKEEGHADWVTIGDVLRQPRHEPATSSSTPDSLQPADWDDQLRRLAKLKQEGLVSEDEFNKKKRSLLGI